VAEGVWNAVVIWRELQARGYAGGISIIRDYVRPKRALRAGSRATVRFETEPGRQLQMDSAVQRTVIAGQPVEVHFAVSTLSCSRRFHIWGTDSEDAAHTYEAVVRAFEWFGGVPAEVLYEYVARHIFDQNRPGHAAQRREASTWPRRKLSRVWSSAKRAYTARDHASTRTKQDSRRRPPPTGTAPKLPQSTCACSPGSVSRRR
jgi:transposase